jgi:hypothetical protein
VNFDLDAILTYQHPVNETLDKPTKWPSANARLLGLGAGLPVNPLDRLANFSADEFERFTLEWADGYLRNKLPNVDDIQQRGGAGDKGRDIVVWFGSPSSPLRHWHLYQCKRYATALGAGKGIGEIAKVLFYSFHGDYTLPSEYWFVTRKGVTGDFQDLIDDPQKLRNYVIKNWDKDCSNAIKSKKTVALEGDFADYVSQLDFGFIRVKQPLDIVNEHGQTKYHPVVFGALLIDRPPPLSPPSHVAEAEQGYVAELFKVIGEMTGTTISDESDFAANAKAKSLFERSRMTFYSAEGLKELARDQMSDAAYFDELLGEFRHGLYYTYSAPTVSGYNRLSETVKAAQAQQVASSVLKDHITSPDREGICHHLANNRDIAWCDDV